MANCLCFGQRKKTKKPEKQDNTNTIKESNEQCTTPSAPNLNLETGKQKTDEESAQSSSATQDVDRGKARVFGYRDLATATRNFHRETFLGEGGFGSVYKGKLISGEVFAVKRLNLLGVQGEKEFLVEVLMLSLLRHPNLVNMIGYCAEGTQRLLVLEFMPLGSLEHHLHDLPPEKQPLDWNTRLKIAAGAARGVDYLHNVAKPPVIYRDLKPSNILLDEGYHPKLSDFGLAKFGPVGDKSHVSTRVMGTYGYCAPEYASTGKLTPKSDTYSFGVVLLEIISGRKAYDLTRPSSQVSLVQWARPLFQDPNNYVQFADPKLNGQFPKSDLRKAIEVAAMCVRENANTRPTMNEVVAAMEFLTSQRHGVPKIRGTEATPRRSSPKRPIGKSPLGPGNSPTSPGKLPLSPGKPPLSPGKSPRVSIHDGDREQAVAEAKMWGEKWREKRQQGAGSSSANT